MPDAPATGGPARPVVTFDLFSALLDSRSGGSEAFAGLAAAQGWRVSGTEVYDAWDPRNKAAQRDAPTWVSWRVPATQALGEAYGVLGLDADPAAGVEALVDSLPAWPAWPDVRSGLQVMTAADIRVGILSNVDDAVLARTSVAPLVDESVTFTSERLGVYKPHREIYLRAREGVAAHGGRLVHVATSARDVRGALEAGVPTVRLRRPGHSLDPDGPEPLRQVTTVAEVATTLPAALGGA